MNSFTPRAAQVLALARREAIRLRHDHVGTEHLLLGLLKLGQGVAAKALLDRELDLATARIEVENQVGRGPEFKILDKIPHNSQVKRVLAFAGNEAKAFNHNSVGTEHILLGLLRESAGGAFCVFTARGLDIENTYSEVLEHLGPRCS